MPIYWIYHLLLKVSSSFHIHFHSLFFVLYCPCNKIIPIFFCLYFAKIVTTLQTFFCWFEQTWNDIAVLIEYFIIIYYSLELWNSDKYGITLLYKTILIKQYHPTEMKKSTKTILFRTCHVFSFLKIITRFWIKCHT